MKWLLLNVWMIKDWCFDYCCLTERQNLTHWKLMSHTTFLRGFCILLFGIHLDTSFLKQSLIFLSEMQKKHQRWRRCHIVPFWQDQKWVWDCSCHFSFLALQQCHKLTVCIQLSNGQILTVFLNFIQETEMALLSFVQWSKIVLN